MAMDWFKDLSPAALQLVGLVYVVRYFGEQLRDVSTVLRDLVAEVSQMRGRLNGPPRKSGA
jgi:hypothetical protein